MIDRYTILKDQSAPANLEGVAPTAADVADGRIDGTAGGMEYRRTSGRRMDAVRGWIHRGARARNVRRALSGHGNAGRGRGSDGQRAGVFANQLMIVYFFIASPHRPIVWPFQEK